MQMVLKFKTKKAYDTCHTFINGSGFCFRPRKDDSIIEFFYEYTMLDVASMCKNVLGLEDQFEIVK
jgi:hypothetical protein